MTDREDDDRSARESERREMRRRRRQGDPDQPGFIPETMDKSVIAIPLLDLLDEEDEERRAARDQPPPPRRYRVIIDLNLEHHGGRERARERVMELVGRLDGGRVFRRPAQPPQYVFAELTGEAIRRLVKLDQEAGRATRAKGDAPMSERDPAAFQRAIYRIWPDFKVRAFLNKSLSTVKADAARSSFSAMGHGIVWAVIDSGVDMTHEHFKRHQNLVLPQPLRHYDFTFDAEATAEAPAPDARALGAQVLDLPPSECAPESLERREQEERGALTDDCGHGTHVAGIIAGEIPPDPEVGSRAKAVGVVRSWNEDGRIQHTAVRLPRVSGMAPTCKLVSMKVLDANGEGHVSDIISALEQVQAINGHGRRLLIHGLNLSVGYDFQPEWFACGHSPLCVEVDRLVRSGVVVVVAAGNTGYGFVTSQARGVVAAGMNLSINDPGNADLAITVGSTHREMPHTYGVSYFSSKGPTGDGRQKPDVIAPGEKILSCAAGRNRRSAEGKLDDAGLPLYIEQSGTSMAAPHVSGVAAAFLSIRREFIGRPEAVKRIFMETATDLNRDRYFQGAGLVDLMRAIQSV